jgi:hypothetical protein
MSAERLRQLADGSGQIETEKRFAFTANCPLPTAYYKLK